MKGGHMMADSVTLEMPNGERTSVSLENLSNDVARLAQSAAEFGYALTLTLSTHPVAGSEQQQRPAEEQQEVRIKSVARKARAADETPRARRPRAKETRPRRPFDVEKLQAAMRKPDFKAHAYAKANNVNSSLVYYHVRRLNAEKQ
jgi:hypothetical protein